MVDFSKIIGDSIEKQLEDLRTNGFPNVTAQDWQLPFHIQNWPSWISELSPIKTVGFSLSDEWSNAIIDAFGEKYNEQVLGELAKKVDDCGIEEYFIRLGSRSPKDSYGFMDEKMKLNKGKLSVGVLVQSERVHVDLQSYKTAKVTPWIFLREWHDGIHELNEFRCYVINGELLGVSQYQCYTKDDASVPIKECRDLVKDFWRNIKDRWNKDIGDGVFDVWISDHEVNLLEINPPNVSDPCLFRDGFCNEVRYVNQRIRLEDNNGSETNGMVK